MPLTGLVIREQSGFYWVQTPDNTVYQCRLRGKLKEEAQSSDIAAIGDRVTFTPIPAEGLSELQGVIESVTERTSVLSRAVRTTGKRGGGQTEREHVLIANADQALFVFAAAYPSPDFILLDRFLVTGEKSGIPKLVIVVNKVDLQPLSVTQAVFAPYVKMGYDVRYTSAAQHIGIEALYDSLASKISILTGPSGVGKSSLLNALQPGLARVVKSVSDYSQEGQHTTRDSALIRLNNGGYLADTPGIRQLAVWDVEPDELDAYFMDIAAVLDSCRFRDCTHTDEPDCAVRRAVETGEIAPSRYQNFLYLRKELRETFVVYDL